jgi:hypothetical protein
MAKRHKPEGGCESLLIMPPGGPQKRNRSPAHLSLQTHNEETQPDSQVRCGGTVDSRDDVATNMGHGQEQLCDADQQLEHDLTDLGLTRLETTRTTTNAIVKLSR